jgi:hypothetical protein
MLTCWAHRTPKKPHGDGISTGVAQGVLASRGISNFSTYSKKAGGVILIGVGIYLFTYLL